MSVSQRSSTELNDFESLFRSEYQRVQTYLLRRCANYDTIEDVLAETFLCAHQTSEQGKDETVTPAWLNVVAKRRLVDHWRRASTQRKAKHSLQFQFSTLDSHNFDHEGRDSGVHETLALLSTRQRQALTLRYLEGHTVTEVATRMRLTYSATESLLARSRRAFGSEHSRPAGSATALSPAV